MLCHAPNQLKEVITIHRVGLTNYLSGISGLIYVDFFIMNESHPHGATILCRSQWAQYDYGPACTVGGN